MKILVLGGTGMIGHRMWSHLSRFHNVFATIRKKTLGSLASLPHINLKNIYFETDVLKADSLENVFKSSRPELVLNCVGIVKQLEASKNHIASIELNTLFPHRLAKLCEKFNSRMIQFSTDCVFSGKKGAYTENDITDATDLYGKSKILGEIADSKNVLTIRTSTIGREITPHGGLLEWFLSQENKEIKGFSNAIYSGFPTHSLANIIHKYIIPNQSIYGIRHISAPSIDKFALLNHIKSLYHCNTSILKDTGFKMKRDLNSHLFQQETSFIQTSWENMIKDLKIDDQFYTELRK